MRSEQDKKNFNWSHKFDTDFTWKHSAYLSQLLLILINRYRLAVNFDWGSSSLLPTVMYHIICVVQIDRRNSIRRSRSLTWQVLFSGQTDKEPVWDGSAENMTKMIASAIAGHNALKRRWLPSIAANDCQKRLIVAVRGGQKTTLLLWTRWKKELKHVRQCVNLLRCQRFCFRKFNIQISSCFSKSAFQLHYSTHHQSQVQSFALSGRSFARNKPSPIPRGSSLPKSPPLAAHPANSPGTSPLRAFCLFVYFV